MFARTIASTCLLVWMAVLPAVFPAVGLARTGSVPSAPGSSNDIADWSRVVYESTIDGNSNIYVAAGDGSASRRLTDNPSQDTAPRLDHGADEIVFVSDRDGNEEIYRMDIHGGNVRRLTHDGGADTGPMWTPDGSQIIFARKGSDDSDLYIMNADGSEQRPLVDDATDDSDPSISSDGARIAWVRRVPHETYGWEGTLWSMNIDGSDQRSLSDPLLGLARPFWSPDDTMIMMDVSGYTDGIFVIPSRGGYASEVVSAPQHQGETDIENNGWSPDGLFTLYTLFYLRYEPDGSPIPRFVVDHTEVWRSQPGSNNRDRITSGTLDRALDWRSTDILPPTSSISALPANGRVNRTVLHWSGSDELSGIRSYDVQYRQQGGDWTDWLRDTTATSTTLTSDGAFRGRLGLNISFRVRARDHALNIEPWPDAETGDTTTTLYGGLVHGRVADNRGFPIPQAVVSAPSPFIRAVQTDARGKYVGYTTGNGWFYEAEASHAGYARSPKKRLVDTFDLEYSPYLPPLDNRIINGMFEAEGTGIPGWRTAGALEPRTDDNEPYSGTKAARIGGSCDFPCLSTPTLIDGGKRGYAPALVPGPDNVIHALWHRATTIEPNVAGQMLYSQRSTNGSWSAPEAVGTYTQDEHTSNVQIAIDGQGALHAVWGAIEGTYYAMRTPGGRWKSPELIGEVQNGRIAADQRGGAHVVYTSQGVQKYYLRRSPQGVWQKAIKLGSNSSNRVPAIVAGPNNDVHVAWNEESSEGLGEFDVLYRTFRADGTRSDVQNLGLSGIGQQFVVDGLGTLHLIYGNGFRTQHPDRSWSPWTKLLASDHWDAPDFYVETYNVWGDPQGGFYVQEKLRLTADGAEQTMLLHWDADSRGTRSTELQGRVPFAVDQNDNIHSLVYMQDGDGLHYSGTRKTLNATSAVISQSLVLATSIHRPALAFMYNLNHTDEGASRFSVHIADAVTSTTVFSTSVDTGWRQGSVDLSAWSGKTISVTFMLEQASNRAFAILGLDEVTLGSWRTPVVSASTPGQVDASVSQELILKGDNFIGQPQVKIGDVSAKRVERVDEQTLRIHLPSSLKPGRHDIEVTNPGGQQAVLPGALQVGLAAYLPLVIR